jgi:hypothetical protein
MNAQPPSNFELASTIAALESQLGDLAGRMASAEGGLHMALAEVGRGESIAPLIGPSEITIFATPGESTWAKNVHQVVTVIVIGGGGGGASGSHNKAGANASGGGGGGGGGSP